MEDETEVESQKHAVLPSGDMQYFEFNMLSPHFSIYIYIACVDRVLKLLAHHGGGLLYRQNVEDKLWSGNKLVINCEFVFASDPALNQRMELANWYEINSRHMAYRICDRQKMEQLRQTPAVTHCRKFGANYHHWMHQRGLKSSTKIHSSSIHLPIFYIYDPGTNFAERKRQHRRYTKPSAWYALSYEHI